MIRSHQAFELRILDAGESLVARFVYTLNTEGSKTQETVTDDQGHTSTYTWQYDMGASQDPQSLHKYLYANANPVMFVDPSGMFGIVRSN